METTCSRRDARCKFPSPHHLQCITVVDPMEVLYCDTIVHADAEMHVNEVNHLRGKDSCPLPLLILFKLSLLSRYPSKSCMQVEFDIPVVIRAFSCPLYNTPIHGAISPDLFGYVVSRLRPTTG